MSRLGEAGLASFFGGRGSSWSRGAVGGATANLDRDRSRSSKGGAGSSPIFPSQNLRKLRRCPRPAEISRTLRVQLEGVVFRH